MYRSSSHGGVQQCWDKVIYTFLLRIGFTQAADGFTSDLLVMNPDWEQTIVPNALLELTKGILSCASGQATPTTHDHGSSQPEVTMTGTKSAAQTPLDERKLDYIHLANDAPPRSQSTINKEISLFLAKNRARNDASNRSEFVYTLAEKRQRLSGSDENSIGPSCARTDAKPLDRDVQMKYDIAKNMEGPLSRTIHMSAEAKEKDSKQKGKMAEREADNGISTPVFTEPEEEWTTARYPGLDERLRNVETHLAVRYVPSAPRTLLARLQFLEEHLIRLERDYPPWAALHFNQPNRGWPPPPRQTPIIVPPHLRPKDAPLPTPSVQTAHGNTGARKTKNATSSLHRAVMERLEVKQAMSDLG